MNGIAAYALAIELGNSLPGSRILNCLLLPAGFRLILDHPGIPCIDVLFFSREAEIVPAPALEIPPEYTREVYGMIRDSTVAYVRGLGLDRIITIGLLKEGPWAESREYCLRIDLSPGMKAVSLYQIPGDRSCGCHGSSRSRVPDGPFETPAARRWSMLDLPEACPAEVSAVFEPGPAGGGAGSTGGKCAWENAAILVSMIEGLDPVLSRFFVSESGFSPAKIWMNLSAAGRALSSGRFEWNIYDLPGTGKEGRCALYAVRLPAEGRCEKPSGMLGAFHARAGEYVLPSYMEYLRSAAMAPVRKEIGRTRKLLKNLSDDLDEAGRTGEFRQYADLLVTNRHLLKKGMSGITLKNFSGEGTLTVPLDPSLDPDRNIRKFFRKARKGARGLPVIRGRRDRIKAEIERKMIFLEQLASLDSVSDLLRHVPSAKHVPVNRDEMEKTAAFRRFRLDDRHSIYVGRNGAENDELTHGFASPSDLWFHAQGSPGSHVILRGADRSTSRQMIETAAAVAAWFSKARNSGTVPVIYTEKRYVRKPRKSRPGSALCQREKTIFVKPALPDEDGSATDE